jgi:NAD(P)-dependent dehydrogenase (short-subunit alcohol dehydrogenase family)
MTMDSMQGKVCLITGATAGIGEVTALELARQGATVVGIGRSAEKCQTVAKQIQQATGNRDVTFLVADLSSLTETRRVAEEFLARYHRLDVLVNNAGAYYSEFQESPDGIELTMALNFLSPFLLTHLLLDRLKASAPARIINVSSNAHQMAGIHFDDLEGRRRYGGWTAYGQSKLGNILFTYELARRLEGSGVTVNALHPGFVATKFGHNNGGLVGRGTQIVQKLVAMSPEKGAQTQIYLASSPDVATVSGKYFVKSKPASSSRASYDPATAKRLWEWAEQMVQPFLEDRTVASPVPEPVLQAV